MFIYIEVCDILFSIDTTPCGEFGNKARGYTGKICVEPYSHCGFFSNIISSFTLSPIVEEDDTDLVGRPTFFNIFHRPQGLFWFFSKLSRK